MEHEKRIKKKQALIDKEEEARKKEVWRSIMAQKIGLKKLTNLTARARNLMPCISIVTRLAVSRIERLN